MSLEFAKRHKVITSILLGSIVATVVSVILMIVLMFTLGESETRKEKMSLIQMGVGSMVWVATVSSSYWWLAKNSTEGE